MAAERKRGFGTVDRLPSGKYRARYRNNDKRYSKTFSSQKAADTWLAAKRTDIERGAWGAPAKGEKAAPALKFGEYADEWLELRKLKPTTHEHYKKLLNTRLKPLRALPIADIGPDHVKRWYAKLDAKTPTMRAHAYSLLATIFNSALKDDKIAANPCRITGAGSAERVTNTKDATDTELTIILDAMPGRLQALVLLGAWCALRFGELTELRRKDIDLAEGVVHVTRGVTRVEGKMVVGKPKSKAGIRDVAIPSRIKGDIEKHLIAYVGASPDALLFPSFEEPTRHLQPSTLYGSYYPARIKAGRPDLRFHDLRHTGAGRFADTGAPLVEIQKRLGHSTVQAAMRYQNAALDRQKKYADMM